MNKISNVCDIQNEETACGAGISNSVINNGVLVKTIPLFWKCIKFPKKMVILSSILEVKFQFTMFFTKFWVISFGK